MSDASFARAVYFVAHIFVFVKPFDDCVLYLKYINQQVCKWYWYDK